MAARIVHRESARGRQRLRSGNFRHAVRAQARRADQAIRHNRAGEFFIQGAGKTASASASVRLYDVWNTPGWATYEDYNDTKELQVRLRYSNAALLEKCRCT